MPRTEVVGEELGPKQEISGNKAHFGVHDMERRVDHLDEALVMGAVWSRS